MTGRLFRLRPDPPFLRRGRGLGLGTFFCGLLVLPHSVAAQEPSQQAAMDATQEAAPSISHPAPADTYSDPEVEALITRARLARADISAGLDAYEARMWERARVGVSGPEFRRERGVFEQERTARIRWSADGDHLLYWEQARRDLPLTGGSSARNPGVARDLRRDLTTGGNNIPTPLLYNPGSDQLYFGRARFLSPLSDTAAVHYRYYSSDRTVRLGFGDIGEEIVLTEVRVEPRRVDPRLISASLWFDTGSGALVRSSYRPARPFDLIFDRQEGEGEEDPSGFLSGILVAEVNFVTIDHGYYDLRWWIPRRFAFEGEIRLGGVAQLPIVIEWSLDDVYLNDEGDLRSFLASVEEDLPPGWRNVRVPRGSEDSVDSVSIFLPPPGMLAVRSTAGPPRSQVRTGSSVLSRSEVEELERVLNQVERAGNIVTAYRNWSSRDGALYFNRVEGLSLGLPVARPVGARTEVGLEVRYGFSDERAGGVLGIVHRRSLDRTFSASLFHRVDPSTEWTGRKGVISSLSTLIFGREHTPFHRAWGIEASLRYSGSPLRKEVRLFFEEHSPVSRTTNAHLARLWSEGLLPLNPSAREGRWGGISFDSRWEAGRDSRRPQAFGRVRTEAAAGTSEYLRAWGSLGATIPLTRRFSSALEGGIGGTLGDLPFQRRFAPGGPAIFRGLDSGELFGEAFWFARAELGGGLPAARLILFLDALEVAARSTSASFGEAEPAVAAGIGISVLDGLFRLDLSREIRGRGIDRWKLFLYRDGLF